MDTNHARYAWQSLVYVGRLRSRALRRIVSKLEAAGFEVYATEPKRTVVSGPFAREVRVTCYSKENNKPPVIGDCWQPVRNDQR
jgi:hypothetical protein